MDYPNRAKVPRQRGIWWKALEYSGVERIEGFYAEQKQRNAEEVDPYVREKGWQEKQTDIKLAVEVMFDAMQPISDDHGFDRALLITRDRDFIQSSRRLQHRP